MTELQSKHNQQFESKFTLSRKRLLVFTCLIILAAYRGKRARKNSIKCYLRGDKLVVEQNGNADAFCQKMTRHIGVIRQSDELHRVTNNMADNIARIVPYIHRKRMCRYVQAV
ncbi:MAG: hypothetical protein FWC80_05220 [Firmicutes bacterium]|nr:hypothetical protein [Bacillota bacterium]